MAESNISSVDNISGSPVRILAIESSCDETSASVCVDGNIRSNYTANQSVHEKYGGVVPELASRAHLQNIVPVVDAALLAANTSLPQLTAIAYTQAPGLIGSLLVGSQFAKSLSLALNVPLIAVNHMQAHVLANLIPDNKPAFPFLCLTVSGGHTQLVVAHSPLQLELIGETIDDAAGEAFDKAAKMLGLPYPGGPLVDAFAKTGDGNRFHFAKPHVDGLNYSFSGLKTSILYFLQRETRNDPDFVAAHKADLCASIQNTVIAILFDKLKKAVLKTGIRRVCIAGGVSANSGLRAALEETGRKLDWETFIPPFEYCTDNAAMIAITAFYKYHGNQFAPLTNAVAARSVW